jgi:DNA (cytosine-5)-methyltransferase 1
VEAGIDIDPSAAHSYSNNNAGARFLQWDLSRKRRPSIAQLFGRGHRLLAGCAPCQPFSKLTNGQGEHRSWGLLDDFARLVRGIRPELVTMENVPELAARGRPIFDRFLAALERGGYHVDWRVVNCSDYGAPQSRKRLVLLASRLAPIEIPKGRYSSPGRTRTVREAIGTFPALASGESHARDRMHVAARLSPLNLKRVRATPRDGGTKDDWPKRLLLDCHQRETGSRYHSVYGRMWWDKPAPTMTTLCNGVGNGRFAHPEQDRAITLREAAVLQSFPRTYDFWPRDQKLSAKAIARLIGNAVPPALGFALGAALLNHVREHGSGSGRGR